MLEQLAKFLVTYGPWGVVAIQMLALWYLYKSRESLRREKDDELKMLGNKLDERHVESLNLAKEVIKAINFVEAIIGKDKKRGR